MNGWIKCELGDALNLKRGFDLPERDRVHGDYPIVSSSGVTGFHNVAMVKGPGVVTGRYGTIGEVFYIEKDFWPLNTSLYVEDSKGNSKRYISLLLKIYLSANQNAAGAVPGVNRNHLHKIKISLPSLPIQRKIAAVLSAYDDLIENNNRRIAILEKMAEELYHEWFVRLRFPGYEKVKVVKGVPEGWRVVGLGEVCFEDRVLAKKKNISDEAKYVGLEHIPQNKMMVDNKGYASDVLSDKLLFTTGDILFGKIRPYLHKVSLVHFDGVCSSDTIVIKPVENIHRAFLYFTVASDSFIDLATTSSTGTKMPRADWDFLIQLKIILPPPQLLATYQQIFDKHYSAMASLQKQIEILVTSRDRLLSRLMSGKIDVEKMDIRFPESMLEAEVVNG